MPKRNLTGGGKRLFDLRGRAAHGVDFLGFFKKIICFFKKKSTGTAILETALTLPVVLYIIFFSIELIRISLAQVAVDAITKELTFYLMANGKIVASEVDAIFNKYRPWGISIRYFRYYIRLYEDIGIMMANSPYGGETIGWAGKSLSADPPTVKASSNKYSLGDGAVLLNKYQTSRVDGTCGEYGSGRRTLLEQSSGVPSGYTFVLTVAMNFPFTSPFIAKLFNGGSNTDYPDRYILWARGSGMIN